MADPNVITPEAAQGHTIYLGFTMPSTTGSSLPVSPLTASSAAFPTSVTAGGNVFHIHITLNPSTASPAFNQIVSPIITTPGPPSDAALRELELKEQLHQRRLTQGIDHNFMSSHRSSVSNTSLTPSASASNSQSDHYSSDAMELSPLEDTRTGNHKVVDPKTTERSTPPREHGRDINFSPREPYSASSSDRDKEAAMLNQSQNTVESPKQDIRRLYPAKDKQSHLSSANLSEGNHNPTNMGPHKHQSHMSSRLSPSPSPTRSEWEESRSTDYQSRRGRTPPGSPPRHRSPSPHTNSRYHETDHERGRTRHSKSIRSPSPSATSDRSYSPSLRDSDSFRRSLHARQRSPIGTERSNSIMSSTTSRSRDDLIVSKAFSRRSRSNSTNVSQQQNDTPQSSRHDHQDSIPDARIRSLPLTSRIESTTLLGQRAIICPFYHPGSQRHPIGTAHPGYGHEQFEEIKSRWIRGETVPPRLLKQGDSINYRQKPHVTSFSKAEINTPVKDDRRQYRNGQRRFPQTDVPSSNAWQASNSPGYNDRNGRAGSFSQPRYTPQLHSNSDTSYRRPDARSLRSPINRPRQNYQPYSRQNAPYRGPNLNY